MKAIKRTTRECLYCGNPNPIILKRVKSTFNELFNKVSFNLPKIIEVAYQKNKKIIDESEYIQYPLIVKCQFCSRQYEIICLSDKRSKDFVKSLLNNTHIDNNMKNQILFFMKKEKLRTSDFYNYLIGITVLKNVKGIPPFRKILRFLRKDNVLVFHILFKKYFATIYKNEKEFILSSISCLEKFNKRGGLI